MASAEVVQPTRQVACAPTSSSAKSKRSSSSKSSSRVGQASKRSAHLRTGRCLPNHFNNFDWTSLCISTFPHVSKRSDILWMNWQDSATDSHKGPAGGCPRLLGAFANHCASAPAAATNSSMCSLCYSVRVCRGWLPHPHHPPCRVGRGRMRWVPLLSLSLSLCLLNFLFVSTQGRPTNESTRLVGGPRGSAERSQSLKLPLLATATISSGSLPASPSSQPVWRYPVLVVRHIAAGLRCPLPKHLSNYKQWQSVIWLWNSFT